MPTITIPLPSGPSKRRLVELAFGDLTMPGYELGRTAEEINDAIDRLGGLMREWPFNTLGFIHKGYGEGEPDELSGIPHEATNAVSAALALRLAPLMGATLSPDAKANLARAMSTLYALKATIPTMPLADYFVGETYADVNPTTTT